MVDDLISWLVGDAASVADPAFLARCFVLALIITTATVIGGQLLNFGRRG